MCSDIYYQSDNIKASNLSVTDNYLEGAKTTITLSYQNDCDIYDNFDTIFIDEINFKEFAREAYEQVKALKDYWEPTEPPKLIHFCYVR